MSAPAIASYIYLDLEKKFGEMHLITPNSPRINPPFYRNYRSKYRQTLHIHSMAMHFSEILHKIKKTIILLNKGGTSNHQNTMDDKCLNEKHPKKEPPPDFQKRER